MNLSRFRLSLLFACSLALLVIQAWLLEPLLAPTFSVVWDEGEQLLPVAVSATPETIGLDLADDFSDLLAERSLDWPRAALGASTSPGAESPREGAAADREPPPDCMLWLRLSRHHWVRRALSRQALGALALPAPQVAGELEARHVLAGFLDDEDGDGDFLDAGEITLQPAQAVGGSTEAWLRCAALGDPVLGDPGLADSGRTAP